jgi:hypothetical protein
MRAVLSAADGAEALKRWLFERGGLIALAVLAVCIALAPRHIVDGDNAEFATIGATGGIAHPSGYPLYVLYLRAVAWLPTTAAHAAAIGTAVIAAVQILVLHAACRAWGARALSATVAVAIYAAAPVMLRLHTQAEVFALNGLIAALVLWLAALDGPLRGRRRAGALGLVAGLGISCHLTCVFLAPIGLLGVWRGMQEKGRVSGAAFAVLGLLVGLTPYATLFFAPDSAVSWTAVETVDDLLHHFLRVDYGTFSLSPHAAEVSSGETLLALLVTLSRTWLYLPLAAAFVLLFLRIARPLRETRWAFVMLAASFALAGPLLIARFNIKPVQLSLHTSERFHILPALLLVIPVALAVDCVARWIANRRQIRKPRSMPVAATFAALAMFVVLVALALPQQAAMHSAALERGVRNLLQSLPPDAVVIVATDDAYFGAAYVQDVLGERRDVVVVMWGRVPQQRYRDRISARVGVDLVDRGAMSASSVAVAERILATKRPVFIDWTMANIATSLPTYPYGLVLRVLPRGERQPPLDEVVAINKAIYSKFTFDYSLPADDDRVFASHLHHRYARVWHVLADALGRAGKADDRDEALAFARALGPR